MSVQELLIPWGDGTGDVIKLTLPTITTGTVDIEIESSVNTSRKDREKQIRFQTVDGSSKVAFTYRQKTGEGIGEMIVGDDFIVYRHEEFSPLSLDGCLLWFDLSKGSNNDPERNVVKDLSGNNKDLTATNFSWNNTNSGYIGGGLKFNGTNNYLFGEKMLPDGLSDVTIFIKRQIHNKDQYTIFDYRGSSDYLNVYDSDVAMQMEMIVPSQNIYSSCYHAMPTNQGDGASLPISKMVPPELISYMTKYEYNGVPLDWDRPSKEMYSRNLAIGAMKQKAAARFLANMTLYEVIVYDHTLSQDEINAVVSYLKSK